MTFALRARDKQGSERQIRSTSGRAIRSHDLSSHSQARFGRPLPDIAGNRRSRPIPGCSVPITLRPDLARIGRALSCRNPFGRRASFDHQRKQCGSSLAPESRHQGQASWRRKDSPDHQTARGFERGQRRPGMGEIPSFPGRAEDGHRAHDGQKRLRRACLAAANITDAIKPKGNAPNAVDLHGAAGCQIWTFGLACVHKHCQVLAACQSC